MFTFNKCQKVTFFLFLALFFFSLSSAEARWDPYEDGMMDLQMEGGGTGGGCCGTSIVASPVVNPPTITPNGTTATFVFTTDVDATANVHFGLDTTLGCDLTDFDGEVVATKNHNITVGPLTSGQAYDYRIEATASGLTGYYPSATGCRPFNSGTGSIIDAGPASRDIQDTATDGYGQERVPLRTSDGIILSADLTNWKWREGATILLSGSMPYTNQTTNPLSVGDHTLTLEGYIGATLKGQDDIIIHVLPAPNATPVFSPLGNETLSIETTQALSKVVSATDPDGDTTTMTVLSNTASAWLSCPSPMSGTPTATITCTKTATAAVGSYTVSLEARDNRTPPAVNTKTITINVTLPNNAPYFTAPSGNPTYSVAVGDAFTVTVTATDNDVADTVTLSVLSNTASAWLPTPAIPPASRPVSMTFSGTPTNAHIGSYSLILRATDNRGAVAASDKIIAINVVRFKEVSGNLPSDSNRIRGADARDIDGDGDLDLIVGHSLYNVTNYGVSPPTLTATTLSTRVWINNGSGVFTDGTAGRLRNFSNVEKSFKDYGLRLGPKVSSGVTVNANGSYSHTGVLDLWIADVWDSGGATGQEYGQGYRLENNGSGTFRDGNKFVGEMPVDLDRHFDVEIGKKSALGYNWLLAFLANAGEGERYGTDTFTIKYIASQAGVYGTEGDIDGRRDDGMEGYHGPRYFKNIGRTGDDWPVTSDFELADIDGDGDLDVFAGGTVYYDYGGGKVAQYDNPPKLYLDVSGTFDYERTTGGGTFPTGWWAPTWSYPDRTGSDTMLVQRGAFADFNGDGKQDLAVVDRQQGFRLYRNTRAANAHGNAFFVRESCTYDDDLNPGTPPATVPIPCLVLLGSAPFNDANDVVAGDVNGDNKPDLVFIGGAYNTARRERVFMNTTTPWPTSGAVTFAETTDTTLPNVIDNSEGGILFDMEGDGDLDLFVYNNSYRDGGGTHIPAQPRLYKNTTLPAAAGITQPPAPCLSCGGGSPPVGGG